VWRSNLSKSILVLGIDSLIGGAFARAAIRSGHHVAGTTRRAESDQIKLDVTWDIDLWPNLESFDWVFVCASLNELNQCDLNPELSFVVNVECVRKALVKYRAGGTKFLFLSSAHVFSGARPFQSEGDRVSPRHVLGLHKAISEAEILNVGGVAIRVTKVVDYDYRRFIRWAKELVSGRPIEALSNLNASLVSLDSVIKILLVAVQDEWGGLVHVSGPEERTYFDIARLLAESLRCDLTLVQSVAGVGKWFDEKYPHAILERSRRLDGLGIELGNTKQLIDDWCREFQSRTRSLSANQDKL
jgi:dTDP-4-dehydrorhamnose reductase